MAQEDGPVAPLTKDIDGCYQTVNRLMLGATSRSDALGVLASLRSALLAGGL